MTLLEKITTLNFFDFLRKIKEILLELYNRGNNESTITIHIIDNGNFTIPDGVRTRMITLTDSNPQIVTLPAIENAIGTIYFVSNASSGDVNIVSKTGSNDIWDSNTLINDKQVPGGTTQRIINDGTNFKML